MATFSVFIKFLTLAIFYVKSEFIPHREHLIHTVFSVRHELNLCIL
jgi:hypothetical protein